MNGKKIISTLYHIITTSLFIVLIFTMILIVSSNLTEKDTSLFGYQFKFVLSGSMEPNIKTGSVIAIKSKVDKTDLNKGDVITFLTKNESIVTHRIVNISKNKEQYITKGDANNREDVNPVIIENIIGKYSGFTIPFLGYIIGFVSSPQGFFLFLIIPGVILIINSVVIFRRVIRHTSQSKEID